ncbi:CRISPR-associated endonuclease Cas2, partial [Veillonellaceae bacterium M2-8]|nr:CRISPR-associated endonuclease Cas2 [Veillonellaceae bacterium M2-8]
YVLSHYMTITEKQFSRMELLVGSVTSEVVDTTERMIIL